MTAGSRQRRRCLPPKGLERVHHQLKIGASTCTNATLCPRSPIRIEPITSRNSTCTYVNVNARLSCSFRLALSRDTTTQHWTSLNSLALLRYCYSLSLSLSLSISLSVAIFINVFMSIGIILFGYL